MDIVIEDGRFYRNFKPTVTTNEHDSYLIGFNGVINLEDNETSLIYTKRIRKIEKNNTIKDSNTLVLDNFNDERKIIDLSHSEERDCIELYEEYLLNPELFIKKQHLLKKKLNSQIKLNLFDIQRGFIKKTVDMLYDEQ